jgi:hypothetical protein
MPETEGHVEATEGSGTFGAALIAKRPITRSMTDEADVQKPSEPKSVLLAIGLWCKLSESARLCCPFTSIEKLTTAGQKGRKTSEN